MIISSRKGAGRAREGVGGRATSAAGFTLIETSIALLILMIAGLSAISVFSFAMKFNSVAADRATVLGIVQQRMERLRAAPFDDPILVAGTTNTTVTTVGRNYAVTETVCEAAACGGSPTLKRITVQVTPIRGDALSAGTSVTGVTLHAVVGLGPYAQ